MWMKGIRPRPWSIPTGGPSCPETIPVEDAIYHWNVVCWGMASDLIQIDKVGRVVLPKAVRDRLGLEAGDRLQVSLQSGGVELRPTKPGPRLEEEDGLLVLKGVAWSGESTDPVARERDARLEDLILRTTGDKS